MDQISKLVVNGAPVPVHDFAANFLTQDALTRFELESVSIFMALTNMRAKPVSLISPRTFGLIYFVPSKTKPSDAVSSDVCVRLEEGVDGRALLSVHRYDADSNAYIPQMPRWRVDGGLGCTAIVNLGFCLLETLLFTRTSALTVVSITDADWLQTSALPDEPVADGAITSYCQALSIERMTTPQSGDCPYYSECKHQSGTRCDFYKAKCRKV